VSWLAALPHQIPFRAASTGRRIDDKTIEGEYLCAAGDPELFLAEAMAQLAGGLVFDPAMHGFLSGIDRFELDRRIDAGDVVRIAVHLDAELGGLFRFTATGAIDGVEVARGRFYLAGPSHANS
jgi:3-hydroxymyristoyl/3-hydroxydecanoyl-(acyl carrier protein) dehydratase